MKKKIMFLIIMFFCFISSISAKCDYSTISRLKSLVTNINISYDYYIEDNFAYFNVTLTNIIDGMYFVDTLYDRTYSYYDTNNGEITITGYNGISGSYKFYSSLSECYGTKLGTKYYKFPIYNIYYTNSLCSDIPNYSLCQKWVKKNYSYDEFLKKVTEYKSKNVEEDDSLDNVEKNKTILDVIIQLYVNYYYYFLGSIIIICSTIIFIKRRKDRFKL